MSTPGGVWPLCVQMPDGARSTLTFATAATWLDVAEGTLRFALGSDDAHAYVQLQGNKSALSLPSHAALPLEPDVRYELTGDAVTVGRASLWVLQYNERQRIGNDRVLLSRGPFRLVFVGHEALHSNTIVLRLQGRGTLKLGGLRLTERRPAPIAVASEECRIGPAGDFRVSSVFYDPAGYRPLTERHHSFYETREPSWYAPLAQRLGDCARVLDVGCGPGLLLAALAAIGVGRLTGLERDPVLVRTCRAKGLPVVEHDLNWPFPFVPSRSFDGAVIHHSLDYLAPIAMLGTLRETHRVLAPGGRLIIASRSDGRAGGDPVRTIALTQERLQGLLDEAGFEAVELVASGQGVSATARRGAGHAFAGRAIDLAPGVALRPWRPAKPLLSETGDAWDALSRRDFTPVTTPAKEELGEPVSAGYYTGYREDADGTTQRTVCRATTTDGQTWTRDPAGPVLHGGREAEWDDGGVAAGSVLRLARADEPFVMYYSARGHDGAWAGIGLARSSDGVSWHKHPDPVLRAEEFAGLRHLALADVLQTADGTWLMHCEGMRPGGGWEIYQAHSVDGLTWAPASVDPVLPASAVPWGAVNVANPKCVEPAPGLLVLGVNTAGADLGFDLSLATSDDGRRWTFAGGGPLICAGPRNRRIESFVTTATGWRDTTQRAYFFAASTNRTDSSSDIFVAEADPEATWAPEGWATAQPGLYQVRDGRLFARAGRAEAPLTRSTALGAELQSSGRLASGSQARVRIALQTGDASPQEILDASQWPAGEDAPLAWCVRVLRPQSAQREIARRVWRGTELVDERQWPLVQAPDALRESLAGPDRGVEAGIDHCELWAPDPPAAGTGDAHMYAGACRTGDPLLPDVTAAGLLGVLDRHGIARALVAPYGSARALDGLDEIRRAARAAPDRVHPLTRLRALAPGAAPLPVDGLELLWQLGEIVGVKVHLRTDGMPTEDALQWLQARQALSLWHVASMAQLAELETTVLERFSFPVLLSHFGGYPADRARYAAAIELLDRHEQVFLVSSSVWFQAYLRAAIARHPDRVLLGSDYPAVDPSVARTAIDALALPDARRAQVTGENMRFLLERAAWHRARAVAAGELRFPTPPETVEQERALGFEVVPVDPAGEEPGLAREYWSEREVISWYRQDKPWAHLLIDTVGDLRPRSVLEFGCNVGRNLGALAAVFPELRLVGIDVNDEAVRAGREASGLDLREGDESVLEQFAVGEFDLVFTLSVIDHIADPDRVCAALTRCAARNVLCLEVWLPSEGRVVRQPDARSGETRDATPASYSWHLGDRLRTQPRVWRVDERPLRLHAAALGPFYRSYLAFLEQPALDSP